MVSVVFTSCSKDDDNSDSDLYSYVAVGGATVKNSFVVSLTDYTEAIKSAVGSGLVKQNDQKVIQACDAVYSGVRWEIPIVSKSLRNILTNQSNFD